MNRKPNTLAARMGFTLVELLVVLVIISILATTVLFGISGVQTNAREQRTKAQIARIHDLIAEKWESYETRRVTLGLLPDPSIWFANDIGLRRLIGLREIIRWEMPDRISDVRVETSFSLAGVPEPTLLQYYRFIDNANVDNSGNRRWTNEHEGAECLYMILSRIRIGDSNGLDSFSEREIGDVDNDGMPELLDAWGQPIEFLRWAPGFGLDENGNSLGLSTLNNLEAEESLDLAARDPRYYADPSLAPDARSFILPYNMFPLIVSGGANREINLILRSTDSFSYSATPTLAADVFQNNVKYSSVGSEVPFPCDPFFGTPGGETFGARIRDNSGNAVVDNDNISNHLLETSL